jgi:hypothetical protein
MEHAVLGIFGFLILFILLTVIDLFFITKITKTVNK